jgi:DNA-binding response OmpR family regulator
MARGRLEQPLAAAGYALATTSAERLEEALRAEEPEVVILDLDAGGRAVLDRLQEARARGAVTGRVVGYFSHVDAELGAAAQAAGCTALPRGRFWRSLPEVLAAV